MARGIRRTDTDPGWINRKFREIDAAIRELRSAKRVITNLTIPSSDGATSNEIVEIGDMPHGDRGLRFWREDGVAALELRKTLSSASPQVWRLFDRTETPVVAENAFGRGLDRPYLEHPFQPVAATSGTAVTCGPYGLERTTSSTTFETLFAYDGKAQNMFLDFKFAVICSDATTAGQVQVIDLDTATARPGFALPPWLGAIPTGTTSHLILNPLAGEVLSMVGDVGAGGYQRLGVQARRTAGAGTIALSVVQSVGG